MGIIKGEQWLCQKGQDNMDPSKYPYRRAITL